jgi:hypothetical protein
LVAFGISGGSSQRHRSHLEALVAEARGLQGDKEIVFPSTAPARQQDPSSRQPLILGYEPGEAPMKAIRRIGTVLVASTIALVAGILTAVSALAVLPPPDPDSSVQAPQAPTPAAAAEPNHTVVWALLAAVALVALIGLVTFLVGKTTRRRHHTRAV